MGIVTTLTIVLNLAYAVLIGVLITYVMRKMKIYDSIV